MEHTQGVTALTQGAISGFDPIEFTLLKTTQDYRVEYYITRNKVQLHIWPTAKEFPENISEQLAKAFAPICEYVSVCEYVPEVLSWYAEIAGTPMSLDKELVESWLAAKFV